MSPSTNPLAPTTRLCHGTRCQDTRTPRTGAYTRRPAATSLTPETLEEEAGALVDAMTGASHDVFKPRQLLRGEAQKWWNAECTDVLEKVQGAD
jgi:hypothetical protein